MVFYCFGSFLNSLKGPALSVMKVTDKTYSDFGGSKACFPASLISIAHGYCDCCINEPQGFVIVKIESISQAKT